MRFRQMISCAFVAASLSACSPQALFDGEGSNQTITPDTPLVVADGVPAVSMGQVALGQPLLAADTLPVEFEAVDAEPNCRMPRPSNQAKVAYVYTYGGGVKTPLQYIADGSSAEAIRLRMQRTRELAEQVSRKGSFEQAAIASEASNFAKGNAVEWTKRIDVLVTETDAPVFLVLTSYNSVMWNIQKAPGARIDGVIVSAYEGGAIANGVEERRTGFMGMRGAPNSRCRLEGRGDPVPVEARIEGAKNLNPDFDAAGYRERWEAEYREGLAFFGRELPQKVGKRPEWLLTNARGNPFSAVLVGPVPDQPFEQQPITRLQIPSYVAPFWGTRRAAFDYFGLS